MNLHTTYQFFKELQNDQICFVYRGLFDDGITQMVVSLVDSNINHESEFSKIRNKVSFLLIESFQNILRHGNPEDEVRAARRGGLFIARQIRSMYYIISANLVRNEHVDLLKEKLKQVNEASTEELKALQMDLLENKALSEKGGAGLGLIQMVRKSRQKLDYDFVQVSDKYSFFYLQLKVLSKVAEQKKNLPPLHMPLSHAKEIHRITSDKDIFIIHKGNFVKEAIRPILDMIEDNMENQWGNEQKVAFHVLVEILQNISKHAYMKDSMKEGIFIMGTDENQDNYIISAGNLVAYDQVEPLKAHLEKLRTMSREDLRSLYRRKLMSDDEEPHPKGAGIGLIDIARECYGRLEYEIIPLDEEVAFFALLVKL